MQPPPLRFLSACKQPKVMNPGIHINPYVQPRVEGTVVHHDHVLTNRRTWAIPIITNGSLLQRGVSSLKSCLMLWVSRLPSQVFKGLGIHSSSSTQWLDHLFQLLIFFLTEKSMAEVYNCMQMYHTIILRVFWKWITIFTLDIEMWSTVALSDHASGALCLFAKGCIESFVHLYSILYARQAAKSSRISFSWTPRCMIFGASHNTGLLTWPISQSISSSTA